jgi:threonine aldolase
MRDPGTSLSFRHDGPDLTPRFLAHWLRGIAQARTMAADSYLLGGAIADFEAAFAALVGKERAIFMPTGTLANHLAVRALARGRDRVLVQERGHIYNDAGDCLQRLSGLSLVPLGKGRASFTLDEVREAVEVAGQARVRVDPGVLVIETPVRRLYGARFDHAEMVRICAFCRERGIGLHLDGARIFIESAYTGIPVKDYAALFDTVYVSLYKSFGTPCGAMLAGPSRLLEGMHHERRMFGGALNQGWMFAAMAQDTLVGSPARLAEMVAVSEQFKARLRGLSGLRLTEVPDGTNVCRLEVDRDAAGFRSRLEASGIGLPDPEGGAFYLRMNESLLGEPTEGVVECFRKALQGEGA